VRFSASSSPISSTASTCKRGFNRVLKLQRFFFEIQQGNAQAGPHLLDGDGQRDVSHCTWRHANRRTHGGGTHQRRHRRLHLRHRVSAMLGRKNSGLVESLFVWHWPGLCQCRFRVATALKRQLVSGFTAAAKQFYCRPRPAAQLHTICAGGKVHDSRLGSP
jgi:hypothetical protein